MSTLGLITIEYENEVLMKIVAGCCGQATDKASHAIRDFIMTHDYNVISLTPATVYKLVMDAGLGCEGCLTIIDNRQLFTCSEDGVINSYSLEQHVEMYGEHEDWPRKKWIDTFNDPLFNPRWKYGTAYYTRVLRIHKKNCKFKNVRRK